MTIGETIRYYRKDIFGWTQKHLGDLIGVTPSCIGHYEHDRHKIPPEILRLLCEIFNIPASTLLGTSGQERVGAAAQNKASGSGSRDFSSPQVTDSVVQESVSFPPLLTVDITAQENDMLERQLLNTYDHLEAQDKRRLVRYAAELNERAIKARKDAARKTRQGPSRK